MAINKVIDRNDNVLIDLTNDTVSPGKVLNGVKFHDKEGNILTGGIMPNELDDLKYTFMDYDGEIVYTFTDEEIDSMTELPAGPDHTVDNLTFQDWNWTLDELKNWDRTRPDRPIVGAHFVTTDGKIYIKYRTTARLDLSLKDYFSFTTQSPNPEFKIDWGDGTDETLTVSSSINHTFPERNTTYEIVIEILKNKDNLLELGGGQVGGQHYYTIEEIKIPSIKAINVRDFKNLKKINIPKEIKNLRLTYCRNLKAIVVPKSCGGSFSLNSCSKLRLASLHNDLTIIGSYCFDNNHNLEKIVLSDNITTIDTYAFRYTYSLKNICLPKNLTKINSYAFGYSNVRKIFKENCINNIELGTYSFAYNNILSEFNFDKITDIGTGAFTNCKITHVILPDSITSIGSSSFTGSNYSNTRVLDLSQQSKIIPISGNIINYDESIDYDLQIFVPSNLIDAYKKASYWSNYAKIMIPV